MEVSGGTAKEKHTTCHLSKKTKAAHSKCQANALILGFFFSQSEGSEACVTAIIRYREEETFPTSPGSEAESTETLTKTSKPPTHHSYSELCNMHLSN